MLIGSRWPLRAYLSALRRISSDAVVGRQNYQPVIGLEVHVQLALQSKLFSRAPAGEEAGPNVCVAPFDMATPGTLPKLNKQAVMLALHMSKLLNCEVPPTCRFDRKHYFYADMPAGYQITQSESPIARNGRFGFYVYGEKFTTYRKEVSIVQLQLEQDSGKTIHHGNISLIDLNRAGSALVEVVTAPDFSSAIEAVCFVEQLRLILMHYRICDGELHKGQMRVDANVSLSSDDQPGVRTEIKNMNSIRHLHTAINFEMDRQYGILSNGGRVINETRACDAQGRTVSMRDKEEDTDYRIMPEPNLPTLKIRTEWLDNVVSSISSIPKYQQYITYGFDARRAVHYAEDPLLSNFVDLCSSRLSSVSIDQFIVWLDELKQLMQRTKAVFPPQSPFFAEQFMSVVDLFSQQRITKQRAIESLRFYVTPENQKTTLGVEKVLQDGNLWRIHDGNEMMAFLNDLIENNEDIWKKAKAGHTKSISKMRNLMIEKSLKRIDADDAMRCVQKRIERKQRP